MVKSEVEKILDWAIKQDALRSADSPEGVLNYQVIAPNEYTARSFAERIPDLKPQVGFLESKWRVEFPFDESRAKLSKGHALLLIHPRVIPKRQTISVIRSAAEHIPVGIASPVESDDREKMCNFIIAQDGKGKIKPLHWEATPPKRVGIQVSEKNLPQAHAICDQFKALKCDAEIAQAHDGTHWLAIDPMQLAASDLLAKNVTPEALLKFSGKSCNDMIEDAYMENRMARNLTENMQCVAQIGAPQDVRNAGQEEEYLRYLAAKTAAFSHIHVGARNSSTQGQFIAQVALSELEAAKLAPCGLDTNRLSNSLPNKMGKPLVHPDAAGELKAILEDAEHAGNIVYPADRTRRQMIKIYTPNAQSLELYTAAQHCQLDFNTHESSTREGFISTYLNWKELKRKDLLPASFPTQFPEQRLESDSQIIR